MTTSGLWSEIQAQGANLRQVIGHLHGPERARLEEAASLLRNDRPVALVGIGSAAYLCMPAESYLTQRGRVASVVLASDAFYNQLPALGASNIVINSRSGETVEVVRLARALADRGTPFVAITNEPESALARLATCCVTCNSQKDQLVSINIVTGMMTATTMLAAAMAGQLDALRGEIERLPDAMEATIKLAVAQADELAARFADRRPIYLLYRSALKGAAYCARLVLEEAARTPGVALEAGEFRHGPNEVVDERFAAMVFVPGGAQGRLNQSLGRDIADSGGAVALVGALGAESDPRCLALPLPPLADALLAAPAVVPAQILAYKLAERQGYTPGEVRYITKVIVSEEGIPRQAAEATELKGGAMK
jgi:glucosamine--fructose-6-phosphate aminotransferase (isomerizing)